MGGAIFSAGADGSVGVARSFWARVSGRAGSGAGVVGRSPPGFDSAGGLSCGVGDDCNGGVACANCRSATASWTNETPDMASPAIINTDAGSISFLYARLLSSGDISFTANP